MRKGLSALLLAVLAVAVWADSPAAVGAEMVPIARQFLAALGSAESQATFALDDEERFNWHYVPRARAGVVFKTMTPEQAKLGHSLLGAALSPEGYKKATNVMRLDQVLFEQSRNPIRDPLAYNLTFFGEPSESGEWGWRLEGHHLSLNFTLHNGQVISTTPSFFGANPATVHEGPHRGLRTLAAEEDLGRRLLKLFGDAQREKVLIDVQAPADIVTRASRKAELGSPAGVAVAGMTPEQKQVLLELLEVYARRLHPELAEAALGKIRAAGLEKIHFAWAGSREPGQPHYYRLHGPTFVIEYDNTQDNANHIHTVWRDFAGDFGLDLLREHYARSPHHQTQRNSKLEIGN